MVIISTLYHQNTLADKQANRLHRFTGYFSGQDSIVERDIYRLKVLEEPFLNRSDLLA